MLVRPMDMAAIKSALLRAGLTWDESLRPFRTDTESPMHFITAGDRLSKRGEVVLPSPADERVANVIDGQPPILRRCDAGGRGARGPVPAG